MDAITIYMPKTQTVAIQQDMQCAYILHFKKMLAHNCFNLLLFINTFKVFQSTVLCSSYFLVYRAVKILAVKKLWQITVFCHICVTNFHYFRNIPYANRLQSAKLPRVLIHQTFLPPKFFTVWCKLPKCLFVYVKCKLYVATV